MLAQPGSLEDLGRAGFIWEPKLDGTRALVYKDGARVRILNRRQRWIEHRYPELSGIPGRITPETCLLDGEIVVLDSSGRPNFRLLQGREHQESQERIEILSRIQPATLVVFDVLAVDRELLLDEPLVERKRILSEIVEEDERLRLCYFTRDGERLWEASQEMGLEGVIGKRELSTYQAGRRSRDWLKLKAVRTLDCVIVGYTPGEGWRKEYFGALALGAYREGRLELVGKVGTGFDGELLSGLTRLLKARETPVKPVEERPPYEVRWVRPELVCEVKYAELTQDRKLRAPSFRRLRLDKAPSECELPA